MPSLKGLQAFDAVVRHGSISAAARALGVSPSAITQQVKLLEAHLGVALFDRVGGGLRPNEWGRTYHGDVGPAFERLAAAKTTLAGARARTEVVISALPTFASKWLAPRMFDWRAREGSGEVKLIASESEPDLDPVNGHADVHLRVTYGSAAEAHPHRAPLFRDSLVAVCAPSLAAERPVPTAELLRGPLIEADWAIAAAEQPGWNEFAERTGNARPGGTRGLTVSLTSVAIDAATAGRGFALVPFAMVEADLEEGRLVLACDERINLPVDYQLAWSAVHVSREAVSQFRGWLVSEGRAQTLRSRG